MFHLNIASLTKHKDELEMLLCMIDLKFDAIGITTTKLKKANKSIIDTNMDGYQH